MPIFLVKWTKMLGSQNIICWFKEKELKSNWWMGWQNLKVLLLYPPLTSETQTSNTVFKLILNPCFESKHFLDDPSITKILLNRHLSYRAPKLIVTWSSCRIALMMWVSTRSTWRLSVAPRRYRRMPYMIARSDRLIRSGVDPVGLWSGPDDPSLTSESISGIMLGFVAGLNPILSEPLIQFSRMDFKVDVTRLMTKRSSLTRRTEIKKTYSSLKILF